MRVSLISLTLLLLIASYYQAHCGPVGASLPTSCCFSYSKQFSLKRITRYYRTSSMCFNPGVVFVTKNGKGYCANENEKWVKAHIRKLDKKASLP